MEFRSVSVLGIGPAVFLSVGEIEGSNYTAASFRIGWETRVGVNVGLSKKFSVFLESRYSSGFDVSNVKTNNARAEIVTELSTYHAMAGVGFAF